MASIAGDFSIAVPTVEFIVRGRNWRGITGPIATTGPGERYRGELHWKTKLTDVQVEMIRRAYANGVRQTELAQKFGVAQTHISRIVRGENRRAR